MSSADEPPRNWTVYIVRCADGTLYTGIATDVVRRIDEHNGSDPGGAKYTRSRRPVQLIFREQYAARSEASRRESEIKRLSRPEKEALVAAGRTVLPPRARRNPRRQS